MQTCPRAALSVICFANASSPKGRAEKPVRTAHLTHQSKPHADLFACCSFRHGLRRATFLREEGFGFPHNPNLSLPLGEMSRSDREGWLPLRGSWICRRQRLREFYKSDKIRMRFDLIRTCQCAAPSVTACAVPPSSGRKALVFRTNPTCLSLWERCRAATERASSLFEGAGFAAGKD